MYLNAQNEHFQSRSFLKFCGCHLLLQFHDEDHSYVSIQKHFTKITTRITSVTNIASLSHSLNVLRKVYSPLNFPTLLNDLCPTFISQPTTKYSNSKFHSNEAGEVQSFLHQKTYCFVRFGASCV